MPLLSSLSSYLSTTQSLIQSPQSPVPLLTTALLTLYVNLARSQVAMDAECIRANIGSEPVSAGTVMIPLSGFTGLPDGCAQGITIRNALLNGTRVDIRPWDWFAQYYLAGPPPSLLATPVMARQAQGAFSTVWVSSNGGSLNLDMVFLPIDLVDDTSYEAVPYPWTDAVPFYAAWYAYMSMQRQADAQTMLARYAELTRRGRTTMTSTNLPENDSGGMGAVMATTKTPLGNLPPQAAQRGG
jgi:hypothetical protein